MSPRGEFRASDADRDQVIDRLHKAATEGRLTAQELEQRVSTALKARTYGELEATVSDIPGARRPARVAPRASLGGWAVSAVRANPLLLLLALPMVAVTAAMLLAATIVWAVMILVIFMLGGRPHTPRPPWSYATRRELRTAGRRPGRHWA